MSSVDMKLAGMALDQTKFAMLSFNKSVFVSTLFFNLKFFWDEKIPTACTNGIDMRVNPAFFLSLHPMERMTLIAHETWHVAFQHMIRLENRNMHCWNKACDYAINEMLQKAGYTPIPNWLHDKKYFDMSAEQIYEDLYKDPNNHNPSQYDDMDYTNPVQDPQVQQQIVNNVMKASMTAQGMGQGGSIPSSIVQTIEEYLTPPVNWRKLFQKFMHRLMRTKLSYKKPKKKYFPEFILPTKEGKSLSSFVVACDSSGSVSDEDLSAFLGQINIARTLLKPDETHMLMFDTSIRDEVIFKKNVPAKYVDFKGRGGTDPTCVIEHVNQFKKKPQCLVIFSDMDFTPLPLSMKPSYPVIWVSYKAYHDPEVEFGSLVIMPEQNR